jgi:hypothetical protein
MLTVTFKSEDHARVALKTLESQIQTTHNHIASAVEKGRGQDAARLVDDLRTAQEAAAAIRGAFYSKHGYSYNIHADTGSVLAAI